MADDSKDNLTEGGIHCDEALEEAIETGRGAVVRIETSRGPRNEGEEDSISDTQDSGR